MITEPLYVSKGFWTLGKLKLNGVDSLVKIPTGVNSLVKLKNLDVSFLSFKFSMIPINSSLIPLCSNNFGDPKLTMTLPLTSSLSYKATKRVISPWGLMTLYGFLFSSFSISIVTFGLLKSPDNYKIKLILG